MNLTWQILHIFVCHEFQCFVFLQYILFSEIAQILTQVSLLDLMSTFSCILLSSLTILHFLSVQQLQDLLTFNDPPKNVPPILSHVPAFLLTSAILFGVSGHILFSALQFTFTGCLVMSSKVSY